MPVTVPGIGVRLAQWQSSLALEASRAANGSVTPPARKAMALWHTMNFKFPHVTAQLVPPGPYSALMLIYIIMVQLNPVLQARGTLLVRSVSIHFD